MSALESLNSTTGIAFGNTRPDLAARVMGTFTGRQENALTWDARGNAIRETVTYVTLPDPDDTLTPATLTALAILGAWEGDLTDADTLTHAVVIACRRARVLVRAALQRDRETVDSLSRVTFDPQDEATVRIIEAESLSPWQASGLSRGAMHKSATAGRPDAITRRTDLDNLREGLSVGIKVFGADPFVVQAIATPDLGSDRAREGFASIARAAGLPTSGRALGASKAKVQATFDALTMAGAATLARTSVIRVKAEWSDEARTLAMLDPRNQYFAPGTHAGSPAKVETSTFPVEVITMAGWVARPAVATIPTQLTRTSPDLNHAKFAIGAGNNLGVKVPSRRKGSKGQTGPTVPDTGSDSAQVFVLIPNAADRAETLAGLLARTV